MQRALKWLKLYCCEAVQNKLKQQKNTKNMLDNRIGWATSMPFALINPTNPRTNLWNFHKKYWELRELKNSKFFWVDLFDFFFFKKYFFCFIPMKTTQSFLGSKGGSKFRWLPWFPANSLLCVILRYIQYMWLDHCLPDCCNCEQKILENSYDTLIFFLR
jgi:hypothetical protein